MTADSALLGTSDRQPVRLEVRTILLALSAGLCLQVLVLLTLSGGDAVDALCYWLTDPANPYNRDQFQFAYSPVVAQLMAPLFDLPFAVFAFLLRVIEVLSLIFLTGPLAGALIFTTPVASEVNAANINLLIAVVMVLGFRWPALWAIPLLTKPSMGVGLVWFLFRKEWRRPRSRSSSPEHSRSARSCSTSTSGSPGCSSFGAARPRTADGRIRIPSGRACPSRSRS